MVQKRETKAINKLCDREILSLSFECGAYFFDPRGRSLVCFVIAYNFNGKYAPEAGKTRMRTAFFTRVAPLQIIEPLTEKTWEQGRVTFGEQKNKERNGKTPSRTANCFD